MNTDLDEKKFDAIRVTEPINDDHEEAVGDDFEVGKLTEALEAAKLALSEAQAHYEEALRHAE